MALTCVQASYAQGLIMSMLMYAGLTRSSINHLRSVLTAASRMIGGIPWFGICPVSRMGIAVVAKAQTH